RYSRDWSSDVCSSDLNPNKLPPITQMTEELKKEIEARYADDEETKKILLDSIPEVRQIRFWVKKDGWDEAVWEKIRGDNLFSARSEERRVGKEWRWRE